MDKVVDYDTDFICNYRESSEEDQDSAYRTDMLRAFKLREWDGELVSKTLDRLFTRLRSMPGADVLLHRLRSKYPQMQLLAEDDDRTLFQILFSFDLFDKTHATICDLLEKGELSERGLASLAENIV
tara:strand:- start:3838 stop:4218 length:381 start_codon:yes stop_codon:yes gene_type:complete